MQADSECSFCLEPLRHSKHEQNSPLCKLRCGHEYHSKCVREFRLSGIQEAMLCQRCLPKLPRGLLKDLDDGQQLVARSMLLKSSKPDKALKMLVEGQRLIETVDPHWLKQRYLICLSDSGGKSPQKRYKFARIIND